MASYASKPAPAKKLREHLLDAQEPFSLDMYISERRYMKSWRPPTRSYGYDFNKGRKKISYATRILASAIYKLIPTNNSQELSNEIVSPTLRNTQLIAGKRVTFSTKCLNACISADYSNIEEKSLRLRSKRNQGLTHASTAVAYEFGKTNRVEAPADKILQWISMEESMQLSTASLLREAPSSNEVDDFKTQKAAISSYNTSIPSIKDAGDSIVSVSLLQLLKNPSIEKGSHVSFSKPKGVTLKGPSESSQCLQCKRFLPQRKKQLLFDSEKEALVNHERNEKKEEHTQGTDAEDQMEIMICDHICLWGKPTRGYCTNKTHQMNFDFSATLEEWCDFHQLKREIGMKIGDSILDDIVRDMADLFLQ